jgi:hypothetical protein
MPFRIRIEIDILKLTGTTRENEISFALDRKFRIVAAR